jgi:hypothetical protein
MHPSCSELKVSDEEEEDRYCSLTCHVGPLNANKAEDLDRIQAVSENKAIIIKNDEEEIIVNPQIEHFRIITIQNCICIFQ